MAQMAIAATNSNPNPRRPRGTFLIIAVPPAWRRGGRKYAELASLTLSVKIFSTDFPIFLPSSRMTVAVAARNCLLIAYVVLNYLTQRNRPSPGAARFTSGKRIRVGKRKLRRAA